MKNASHLGFMFTVSLIVLSLLYSCDSDDGSLNDNSQEVAQIEATAESGTWRITNFNDSGEDETSDFNGYNFSFNADGSLVAANGSDTVIGTWSVTDDDSSDDDSSSDDDIDFDIFFPVPDTSDFEDLNDDWDIISVSSTRIELRDDSDDDGDMDRLTFERN